MDYRHSQGGAVMQVWVYHKMLEDGVLPQNLLGYGFASPSALEGRPCPARRFTRCIMF